MFSRLASYLMGGAAEAEIEGETVAAPLSPSLGDEGQAARVPEEAGVGVVNPAPATNATEPSPPAPRDNPRLRQTEVEGDDWILIDRYAEAAAGMEESWYVTPPACFTRQGPVHVETSPLENLLIEHPSMSVYAGAHSLSNSTSATANTSIISSDATLVDVDEAGNDSLDDDNNEPKSADISDYEMDFQTQWSLASSKKKRRRNNNNGSSGSSSAAQAKAAGKLLEQELTTDKRKRNPASGSALRNDSDSEEQEFQFKESQKKRLLQRLKAAEKDAKRASQKAQRVRSAAEQELARTQSHVEQKAQQKKRMLQKMRLAEKEQKVQKEPAAVAAAAATVAKICSNYFAAPATAPVVQAAEAEKCECKPLQAKEEAAAAAQKNSAESRLSWWDMRPLRSLVQQAAVAPVLRPESYSTNMAIASIEQRKQQQQQQQQQKKQQLEQQRRPPLDNQENRQPRPQRQRQQQQQQQQAAAQANAANSVSERQRRNNNHMRDARNTSADEAVRVAQIRSAQQVLQKRSTQSAKRNRLDRANKVREVASGKSHRPRRQDRLRLNNSFANNNRKC